MLHGIGQARNKPAAADGYQNHVHIRQLLQNLQADGALSGHDPIVVKGVNKRQPLLIPQAHSLGIGIVIHAVHQHHIGPVAAGGLDLGNGGGGRDADGGGDVHIPGGKAHALGMVARGAGDDAPALLLVGQGGDLIVCAPQLEGAGLLQAVGLQIEAAVRHQARSVQHGSLIDDGREHPAGVLEHFHRDHMIASLVLLYIQKTIFCACAVYYNDNLYGRKCQFPCCPRGKIFRSREMKNKNGGIAVLIFLCRPESAANHFFRCRFSICLPAHWASFRQAAAVTANRAPPAASCFFKFIINTPVSR